MSTVANKIDFYENINMSQRHVNSQEGSKQAGWLSRNENENSCENEIDQTDKLRHRVFCPVWLIVIGVTIAVIITAIITTAICWETMKQTSEGRLYIFIHTKKK